MSQIPTSPRLRCTPRCVVGLCALANVPGVLHAWTHPPGSGLEVVGASLSVATFLLCAWIFVRWHRRGLFRVFDWRRRP